MDKTIHSEKRDRGPLLLDRGNEFVSHLACTFSAVLAHRRILRRHLFANPWFAHHTFVFFSFHRFRQEYRLERKVLSELSLDPDSFPVDNDGLSNLIAASCSQQDSRHSISRVVVLHNDRLETFVSPEEHAKQACELSGDFFDNDSFWSGSLTWY